MPLRRLRLKRSLLLHISIGLFLSAGLGWLLFFSDQTHVRSNSLLVVFFAMSLVYWAAFSLGLLTSTCRRVRNAMENFPLMELTVPEQALLTVRGKIVRLVIQGANGRNVDIRIHHLEAKRILANAKITAYYDETTNEVAFPAENLWFRIV